ncbi:MAG: methionine biosynthesis protein MetW [Aliidongia sp.]
MLAYLTRTKAVDGRGMEISQAGGECLRPQRPSRSSRATPITTSKPIRPAPFDYVVLSQTLQATRHPRQVVESLARIGRRAIVSFPNFGYWRVRLSLLIEGRMPRSALLSYPWYDTRTSISAPSATSWAWPASSASPSSRRRCSTIRACLSPGRRKLGGELAGRTRRVPAQSRGLGQTHQ